MPGSLPGATVSGACAGFSHSQREDEGRCRPEGSVLGPGAHAGLKPPTFSLCGILGQRGPGCRGAPNPGPVPWARVYPEMPAEVCPPHSPAGFLSTFHRLRRAGGTLKSLLSFSQTLSLIEQSDRRGCRDNSKHPGHQGPGPAWPPSRLFSLCVTDKVQADLADPSQGPGLEGTWPWMA